MKLAAAADLAEEREGDTDITGTLAQLVAEVQALRVELHRLVRDRTTGSTKRLFSRRQAAKLLGVDRAKVARWVREGRLREVQLDGTPRIPASEIERIEREGLPRHERPRRHRQRKKVGTSNMTDAEVAAELEKF